MQICNVRVFTLKYFVSSQTPEGYFYSCDKICILGKFNFFEIDIFSAELSNFLLSRFSRTLAADLSLPFGSSNAILDYKYNQRFGVGEYRNNLNISLSNGGSFYFGYYHNSNRDNSFTWKIEINPNKCLPCDDFFDFLHFIYSRSVCNRVRISQIDLAIDFPLSRDCFFLEKDRRIYSLVNDGNGNITEYLSRHNSHGFCKLYDKQKESNLDNPLTRFEITLKKFCFADVVSAFPVLRFYDNSQIELNSILPDLGQNDTVFLDLLRLNPEFFKRLTYRKRKLFEPYLNLSCSSYEINKDCYLQLILKINEVFL